MSFFCSNANSLFCFENIIYLVATKLKWERWKWKDIEDRKTPEVGAWRKVYLSSLWTSLFNFVFPRQLSHFKLQDKKTQQCSAVFVMENIIWSFYRSICLPSSAHFLFLSSFFLFSFLFLSLLFTEGTQKREKRNQVFRYNKQFVFQKNIWEGGTKRNLFSSSVSHKSQTNMNISESRRLFHMLLVYQVCFFWSNEQKLLSAVAEHWNTYRRKQNQNNEIILFIRQQLLDSLACFWHHHSMIDNRTQNILLSMGHLSMHWQWTKTPTKLTLKIIHNQNDLTLPSLPISSVRASKPDWTKTWDQKQIDREGSKKLERKEKVKRERGSCVY